MIDESPAIDMEIIISEDNNSVYVKFSGFESPEDTDDYAIFLAEYLPLMLFESDVIH